MDRRQVINKVLIKLSEVNPQLVEDNVISENINIKPLEIAINDLLDESIYETVKIAPIYLLPSKSYEPNVNNVIIDDDGITKVLLPSNYFRFAYIKFPCWERYVLKVLPDISQEYHIQQNRYVRAGYVKPVVFIRENNNHRFLECYTVENTQQNITGLDFKYVEKMMVENIPEQVIPLLVNITAKKTLITMLRFDLAAGLEKEIQNIISLTN